MSPIAIDHPRTPAELKETLTMTALSFRGNTSPEAVAGFAADHRAPGFRPELHRIARMDGKIVGGVLIVDKQLRVGRARLHCGGIADVATHPEYRQLGVGRQLMEHSVDWMAAQGFDVTVLYGIVDYYDKFGYRPIACESRVSVNLPDASHAKRGPYGTRRVRRADLPALARLHDQGDSNLACSFARAAADWQHLWPHVRKGRLLQSAKGVVVGGWVGEAKEEEYAVGQVLVRPTAEAMTSLLAHCAAAAKRAGCERIRFALSHDHPFARHLLEFGANCAAHFPRNGGAMGRVLNLAPTLTATLPELNARLRARPLPKEADSAVELITDLGKLTLKAGRNGLTLPARPAPHTPRVRLDQSRLMQLLCGYRSVDDLARQPDTTIPTKAQPLLRTLFPQGSPYFWPGDRF